MDWKNPSEWAYKTTKDVAIHLDVGVVPLKAGALFIYDPNKSEYIHTFSKDDIPELDGVIARMEGIGINKDQNREAWLKDNFKEVPCPPKLQIKKIEKPLPNFFLHPDAFNKFKDANNWPKEGGDISKKMFKFGEKALFIENWPPGGKPYGDKGRFFKRGKEYPTLGSTEIKVMVINDKGELDFVPFFAVQNTGKIAHWFTFKWWVKITLNRMGLQRSHGRFATDRVPYEDDRLKKPAEIPQPFYIGERLRIVDDFPLAGWGALYHKGDIYPTLGVYRGTKQKPTLQDLDRSEVPMSLAYTEPRALIVNSLGQMDLIPLSQIESTHTYDTFFMLKYYVIIAWYKLMKSFK